MGLHLAQFRVEGVAKGVTEQVEPEHREADGNAGPDRHPRRAFGVLLGPSLQHQAPGRGRFLHAEAEIA